MLELGLSWPLLPAPENGPGPRAKVLQDARGRLEWEQEEGEVWEEELQLQALLRVSLPPPPSA